MLKREITYLDFNDEEVTEIFYFNISKPELIELDVETTQGMSATINKIVEAKDNGALIREFKRIILLAYGQKSEDGKRFIKSDQLREEFSQTAAYQSLFMELATEDEAAVTFLTGVLPKDLSAQVEKQAAEAAKTPAIPPTN